MTREEAIRYLERHGFIDDEVKDMCIEALVQVEQYRALGTVEELKEAREKQIPKKPHKYIAFDGIERNGCPRCYEELGRNEILYAGQKYCSVCGQALKRR